jgi:hypothetical protein
MPDRRGRSYREWSSNESESEESESDHAGEAVLPPRARTLAVEPSPIMVATSQETMPYAIDVRTFAPHAVVYSCNPVRQLFSCLQEELIHEGFRGTRLDENIDTAPSTVEHFKKVLEECQVHGLRVTVFIF